MYKIITSVSAKIIWSLLQFRETAKLKVFKKSALQWPVLQKPESENWQNIKKMIITRNGWHFLKTNKIQAAYF